MSHYYLAAPAQLQRAIEAHCTRWDEGQAQIFKKLLQDFLDGPAALAERIRVDVADLVVEPVSIAPKPPEGT